MVVNTMSLHLFSIITLLVLSTLNIASAPILLCNLHTLTVLSIYLSMMLMLAIVMIRPWTFLLIIFYTLLYL
jgi:hypothetical protein